MENTITIETEGAKKFRVRNGKRIAIWVHPVTSKTCGMTGRKIGVAGHWRAIKH